MSWLTGDESVAVACWRELVETYPDHRCGWWAATCLLGKGALLHGCELEKALQSPLLHMLPTTTRQPLRREELGGHTYRAVDELLRMQAPEGCWKDTPYEFMGARHRPNTIMAITALAASALVAWQEVNLPRVDEALLRAEAYMLDHENLSPTAVEKCYAYSYCLRYWTEKLGRDGNPGELEEARQECARLGQKLAGIQHPEAAWGHEYFNPFATATALVGLAEAQSAGVEIDEGSLALARMALEAVRHPDGGFPYSFDRRQTPLVASAGRAPACELAILLAGGGSQPRLVAALEGFFRHQDLLQAVRVYDYHADRFANGGFFFWHDLLGVSEALPHLASRSRREDVSQGLLELVQEAGETGGAWMDSPNLGRTYGTAMALLTLRNIFDSP